MSVMGISLQNRWSYAHHECREADKDPPDYSEPAGRTVGFWSKLYQGFLLPLYWNLCCVGVIVTCGGVVLQKELSLFLLFCGVTQANPNELTNGVINTAFMLLFKDSIRLFAAYNEGVINLLGKGASPGLLALWMTHDWGSRFVWYSNYNLSSFIWVAL